MNAAHAAMAPERTVRWRFPAHGDSPTGCCRSHAGQEAVVGFYARRIFPWVCELALSRPDVALLRRELLAGVSGNVLEIGFGTGLNLPHYPESLRRLTAIEPNPGMHRRAQQRIDQVGIEVEQYRLRGESLPFPSDSFDCVVSTFTLCSIENVVQALDEVYRVLQPAGQFFFLEHGLSPESRVQQWQRRLNWLERRLAENCHLDRPIQQLVASPFPSVECREFYLPQAPKTHGYLSQGVATKR